MQNSFISSQNKKYYKKKASNIHLSIPVKKVPQSNHKKNPKTTNTMEKPVTLVLYCVEYMVVGFWGKTDKS